MDKVGELKKLLNTCKSTPLIVVGGTVEDFDFIDKTLVPANIDKHVLFGSEDFYKECISNPLLLINGLDTISMQEQEKFIDLIEGRYVWMHKLPDSVQIVITVKSKKKLSLEIQNLTWSWNLSTKEPLKRKNPTTKYSLQRIFFKSI